MCSWASSLRFPNFIVVSAKEMRASLITLPVWTTLAAHNQTVNEDGNLTGYTLAGHYVRNVPANSVSTILLLLLH